MNEADERMRILKMVEDGRISAEDGARLIAALSPSEQTAPGATIREAGPRWLRVRVTDIGTGRTQVDVNLPAQLVRIAGRFGAQVMPDEDIDVDAIMEAVKSGARGRLVDVYDHDEGKHVEVFVE